MSRQDFDLIWLRDAAAPPAVKAPLSREQIVRAAIELADEGGLEAASMRRIAARLGAGATSLYWHVPSRDDLHELMFDAAWGDGEFLPEPTGEWRTDLAVIARRTHRVLRKHPWLVVIGIQPGIGPNVRRYADVAFGVLAKLGLDRVDMIEILAILNNYLFGFAHRGESTRQRGQRAGFTSEQWKARLDGYFGRVRETDPQLADDLETRTQLTSDRSFELGLRCVLDGIAVHFAPAS